ncbi:ribosome-recycling factor, mitochondrial isoform X2 [Lampris incognitus]|uniref:ribosome-recycling factor, mitochondrial isoform X2 n=1 Tax=Lampris incognitus TaxID=2546036 RepID=UPI0024B56204|nr:ribosome-recycling factor, mitochondrial isoform X2 [Lampris incognitus]
MAVCNLGLMRPLLCQSLGQLVRSPLMATARVSTQLLSHQPTSFPVTCTRFYATKKAKAKAKGQQTKVNINSALVEDIINLDEVKEDMTAVLNTLKDDFTRNISIRTSPGALDHIMVTTKDGKFPLNELGQLSMKSPQLILVNMTGSPEATAAASRALRESSNKAKESVRRVRSNAVTHIKKAKEGNSEDTIRLIEKQLQQMADGFAVDIDKQLATKTKELLG